MGSVIDYDEITVPDDNDYAYLIRGIGEDRDKRIAWRNLIQAERNRLAALETLTEGLQAGSEIFDKLVTTGGLEVFPGRKTIEEKKTDGLSADGWYTIAETDLVDFMSVSTTLYVATSGQNAIGSAIVSVVCGGSTAEKKLTNTSIEICQLSKQFSQGILGFRLAKSDTDSAAGFKVQVNLDVDTTIDIAVSIVGQTAETVDEEIPSGFKLVAATQTNNDKTPDGIGATFLIAGSEYLISAGALDTVLPVPVYRAGVSEIRFTLDFGCLVRPDVIQGSPITPVFDTSVSYASGGSNLPIDPSSGFTWQCGSAGGSRILTVRVSKTNAFSTFPANEAGYIFFAGGLRKLIVG